MISHDLSDYEKVRLANIQRNQDYLRSLGFDKPPDATNQNCKSQESHVVVASSSSRTKRSRISEKSNEVVPLRRSSRATPVIKSDNLDESDNFEFPDPIPLGRMNDESDIKVERSFPCRNSEEFGDFICRNQITAQSLMDFIIIHNIDHSEMMKFKVRRFVLLLLMKCHA